MELLFLLFIFILGLFVGSFLLVLSDRLPRQENVLVGRSYCEACRKPLAWYELVPVASYLIQKGKCRSCHVRLSPWYPIAEISTGLLFVIISIIFASLSSIFLIYGLIITCALIVIFIADWKYGIIPFPMVLVGVITSSLFYFFVRPDLLLPHLLVGLVSSLFFFSIFFFTRGRGMGFGDVVYAFFMGFFLGVPSILIGLYIAFLTGALVSLILVLLKRKKLRGDTIAFGPFLVLGTLLAFVFENYFLTLFNMLY